MIASFENAATAELFERGSSRRWGNIAEVALRKLTYLANAATLEDLRVPPGNRLEKLSGNRAGQFSIRINDQFRICFEWRDGAAHLVEITDYH